MVDRVWHRIRNRRYSYFLVKLLAFLVLLYVCDRAVGSFLSYLYFRQDSGVLYRSTFAIERTQADLMIFGSSKAVHGYDSRIFSERLKMETYNAGCEGHDILYHYAVLKCNLERGHVPKVVILDIHEGEFIRREASYDRLSILLPYYERHPEIRDIIEMRSPYEKVKLLSKIYPYNSIIFSIIVGNLEINKERNSDIFGFIPLSRVWDDTIRYALGNGELEVDSMKLKAYENFIRDCKAHGIKLLIVSSPYFEKRDYLKKFSAMEKQIANRYDIPFYDFADHSHFLTHGELFADIDHMNGKGAEVFTSMLVDTIMSNSSDPIRSSRVATAGSRN